MMRWKMGFTVVAIIVVLAAAFLFVRGHQASIISPLGIGKSVEKPFDKYSIINLSKRQYVGSQIVLDEITATASAYTVYSFHYLSDAKKVTGIAYIPSGASAMNKKSVIVQFRGFVDPKVYFPGEGTQHSAEVFAQNGFISLAPDFLGYGGSASPSSDAFEDRFLTYTTALNLLASISTLPQADSSHVGIWGHSNGGQIALTVAEILNKPIPLVLWAPVSSPFPFSILYYSDEADDHGKLLRLETARFEAQYNADLYSLTNYEDRVGGPVQLHQGTADDAVPVHWSDDLAKAMKEQGKEINYFVYPGADHNMAPSADGWNTVVGRDVAFFTKYLK